MTATGDANQQAQRDFAAFVSTTRFGAATKVPFDIHSVTCTGIWIALRQLGDRPVESTLARKTRRSCAREKTAARIPAIVNAARR